jgi:ribosomal protein L27
MSNSNNIDGKDHILHIQKMNSECLIFDDFMYREKKNLNEKTHLFITKNVNIGKNFTIMFLIQVLLHFYNKHLQLNPLRKTFCVLHTLEFSNI